MRVIKYDFLYTPQKSKLRMAVSAATGIIADSDIRQSIWISPDALDTSNVELDPSNNNVMMQFLWHIKTEKMHEYLKKKIQFIGI